MVCFCSRYLGVQSLDVVAVLEVPLTRSFRHIIVELAFEESTVGIEPLSLDQVSALEIADKLLHGLVEYVGSLAIFLAVFPLSTIDVFVGVDHHSLSVLLAVLPVPVVLTQTCVVLFADSVLDVVLPGSSVDLALCSFGLGSVGVGTFGCLTLSLDEAALELVAVRIRGSCLA